MFINLYNIFVVSRLSSRRASNHWVFGYYRRRPSPSNLPIYTDPGGAQGKESPPVSHSSVESNSSGVGNDSPPVSSTGNLYSMLNVTPTSEFAVIIHYMCLENYNLRWIYIVWFPKLQCYTLVCSNRDDEILHYIINCWCLFKPGVCQPSASREYLPPKDTCFMCVWGKPEQTSH